METLLAPARLVFLLPLGFGLVLGLGAAFGLGGDGHHDPDGAHGADGPASDHGADAPAGFGALALFAFGRMPLVLGLMIFALAFGAIGLLVAPGLAGILVPAPAIALAVSAAAGGAIATTRGVARLLGRHVRLVESEIVRREELVGCSGTTILPTGPDGGLLQVHDRRGNLHQIACRISPGDPPLPSGRRVLVVDYDEARGACVVVGDPAARAG